MSTVGSDSEALKLRRQRKLAPLSNSDDFTYEAFFNLSVDMLCVAGYDGYFNALIKPGRRPSVSRRPN